MALRSRLSGVPMGPKLEKGSEGWLWVGGEEGRLLGLEEWGDWLAGVEWSDKSSIDKSAIWLKNKKQKHSTNTNKHVCANACTHTHTHTPHLRYCVRLRELA